MVVARIGYIPYTRSCFWSHMRTVESVVFVQNFVWKNYPLLLVESTSNFAWSLFWLFFPTDLFLPIFSASKIFLKLLLIWPGLDVFPFKRMKKEDCHRVQHVKICRNWSSRFVGRLCVCLKNQTFERQWKMCWTGLNACNLGYGAAYTNRPSLSWQTWRTPEKLYKWYGDRVERGESRKRTEPERLEKWFFLDPRFPKSPPNGGMAIFPPLPQKMPNLFHSGNKRQFKLCSKSVSNYQNQLVEAEKLFKKSHIFAWFHCMDAAPRVRSCQLDHS